MKQIIRYDKQGYGKPSTLVAYQAEEQAEVIVTHVSNDGRLEWLKSYGLVSWAIETK